MPVSFHNSHPDFLFLNTVRIQEWLNTTLLAENFNLGRLSYTFLNDNELHSMNVKFLNHDTLTDVITFDYNQGNIIIGEIYMSIDRIRENAKDKNIDFSDEFHRIIIHGLLHLMGYKDKTTKDKMEMTSKEDYYLSLLP